MARRCCMQACVVSLARAAAVEAEEADIKARGVVLHLQSAGVGLERVRGIHTIESKHCVQSSR